MRRVFPSETDQWFNEKGGQWYVKKGEKQKKKQKTIQETLRRSGATYSKDEAILHKTANKMISVI